MTGNQEIDYNNLEGQLQQEEQKLIIAYKPFPEITLDLGKGIGEHERVLAKPEDRGFNVSYFGILESAIQTFLHGAYSKAIEDSTALNYFKTRVIMAKEEEPAINKGEREYRKIVRLTNYVGTDVELITVFDFFLASFKDKLSQSMLERFITPS